MSAFNASVLYNIVKVVHSYFDTECYDEILDQ